jgi:hypothetical protein
LLKKTDPVGAGYVIPPTEPGLGIELFTRRWRWVCLTRATSCTFEMTNTFAERTIDAYGYIGLGNL